MPDHLIITALPFPTTSLLIMVVLVAIFAASWVMFWMLVQRSTTLRQQVKLTDWGRERRYHVRSCDDKTVPAPLNAIADLHLSPLACLVGRNGMLIQVESRPQMHDATNLAEVPARSGTWNLLIRETDAQWPPTALRPATAPPSAIDMFSLASFPLLGNEARFVVYGTRSRDAAILSRSEARGLLPADVGLLLHGRKLVLDFSSRPFDTTEFERMIAVADQLVKHLPGLQGK